MSKQGEGGGEHMGNRHEWPSPCENQVPVFQITRLASTETEVWIFKMLNSPILSVFSSFKLGKKGDLTSSK